MTSEGSKSRIRWEGDSQDEIKSWPKDIRADLGLDLHRLDNREEPLDSKPMGKSLPGVHELRAEGQDGWYRVLYVLRAGRIYILHCFRKKTNQTAKSDIDKAKQRLAEVKQRNDPQEPVEEKEEEKSA